MFACDAVTLETFLGALGDRKLRYDGSSVTLVPPMGSRAPAVAHELLAAVQPALVGAWWSAVPRRDANGKMLPAGFLCICDHCQGWVLQTTQQSKKICAQCGAKGPRRRLELPWVNAKRGRPDIKPRTKEIPT